ncbi:MAG: DNA-primase RepB domain-containing protein [Eubacteriales bacterium]|nr:DNA-primase RepB domain-containing protein [Eubacteriales bacterium]
MKDFLSVRLKSLYRITGKHSAVSQLFHDLRIRKPDYIKEPAVRLYFPGEVGKETPVELQGEDIERLRKRKDGLKKYLKDVEMQMHERFENLERGKNKQRQSWQANTKPFSSGVLTFSELARNVDIDQLWEYSLKALKALGEKYKIKLLWVAMHTDETTPHFHYMFENLDAQTCRTFQSKLGRDGCSKLQTFFGEQLEPLGFRRGIKKKLSGAEHQDVMESHFIAREKLKGEVKTLQKGIDVLSEKIGASTGILEGILSQKEEILISIEDLQAERQKIMDSLDELETERKKLRRSRDELKQQTAAEKAATTALQQELRKRRTALKEELNEIIQKIEIVKQDNERRKAIAVEVMKENAQEEDDKIQGKIDRYGLQDLYYFLKRVSHHGQLHVQAHGKSFYSKQEYWDEPKLTTPNEVISEWRDLFEQNTCGTDWHLRILGTRPLFVLDDITEGGLDKLRQDGLLPFATVETSPGSFHVYIEMGLKDRQMLTEVEWNSMNSYLIQQYGADKGANAVGHAFRMPIGTSHKYDPPFELQLKVFEDAQPTINADALLRRVPTAVFQQAQQKLSRRYNIPLDGSDAPEWFQNNWKKRREDLIKSGRAPQRSDGTVDDSAVDFVISRDILSAYKDKRSERLIPILNFCHCMLIQEAESRQKARPEDYAIRTLNAVIDRVQLPIQKKSESELEI